MLAWFESQNRWFELKGTGDISARRVAVGDAGSFCLLRAELVVATR